MLIIPDTPLAKTSTNHESERTPGNKLYIGLRGNVMEYFKPGEQMRMMCYSVMTQANSEKEIPSSPNRSRTYDLPIASSDALQLSYRRLVGAKAIKLGSWDRRLVGAKAIKLGSWDKLGISFPEYACVITE